MSFRLLSTGCSVGLVLLSGAALCRGQTEGKTAHVRALEISEPSNKEVITNLNQLSGRSGLQQLEDELSKSLQPFSPQGSLDGVLVPQYAAPPVQVPVIRSRKLKDELERRQNWMFLSPDDMMPGMEDADLLKSGETGLDGQPKKKTPLEQFYERLEREQKGGQKSKVTKDEDPLLPRDLSSDESGSPDDSNLPGAVRDSAQKLKKLLNDESNGSIFGSGSGHGTFSDLFGFGDKGLTKEQILQHKAYMEQYRKVLDGPTPPPADAAFDPFKAAGLAVPSAYGPLNSLLTTPSTHSGFESTPTTLGTIITPSVMPDANATLLNQWNPLYTAPIKAETPRAPMSISMPEAPRRRF